MNILERLISHLSHPIQSLYRRWLYRESISVISPDILARLCRQWGHYEKKHTLTDEERNMIISIRKQTAKANRDNVTRTEAYFSFFQRCPEVHWAFLAHLVSRNGGWNMTDLKGDIIPSVIGDKQTRSLFLFLERANALIFHDAYPQLLLYEESKRRKKKLFHLLPFFAVSLFMRPIWNQFYETNDSLLLTVALIINEQQYIQKRVVENPFYQEHVIAHFPFLLQQWLGFNDVIIPYEKQARIHLAGITVRDFADVYHRIHIGKALYGMLLSEKRIFQGAYHFASRTNHTGSRADFWPHLFSATKPENMSRIYSPELRNAWPHVAHRFPDESDWFNDTAILNELERIPILFNPDITPHYERNLKKLSAIARATN
ncbi:DUF2515 domain-containing protein [Anoxybacteroides tepidamans]|uniref:DUF2515 domain-containing protein n=1 Tax=Anoxybacteroides tepidamans TaxID=265948 RepID=UPI000483BC69|nr:DUF2515 domain-containing protein [Anoxybacillus tepidamans]